MYIFLIYKFNLMLILTTNLNLIKYDEKSVWHQIIFGRRNQEMKCAKLHLFQKIFHLLIVCNQFAGKINF